MNLVLSVVSFLYLAGYTEDGTPYHAERYFVQAEREDGCRWLFFKGWDGTAASFDHEEGVTRFIDRREQASNLAEAVRRTLEKDGVNINDGRWEESRPAYGSDYWHSTGAEAEEIFRERYED